MEDLNFPPRCTGGGEVSIGVRRDEFGNWDSVEFPCPGCIDCLAGQLLSEEDVRLLDARPEPVVMAINDEGVRVAHTDPELLGVF